MEPNARLGGLTTKEGPTVESGRVLVEKEARWARDRDDSSLFGGLRPCKEWGSAACISLSLSLPLSPSLPPPLPPPLPRSLSLPPSLLSLPLLPSFPLFHSTLLTSDFGLGAGCEGEGVVSLLLLELNRRNPSERRRLNFFILLSFPLRVTGGDTGPIACTST